MLQHPSRLSREGWLEMRTVLSLFVLEGHSPSQVLKERRVVVDSGNRDFSVCKGKFVSLDNTWSKTVADVRLDDAQAYREDVRAWAVTILEDTRGLDLT